MAARRPATISWTCPAWWKLGRLGWDLVEMVLADGDELGPICGGPQWFTVRAWLDENPDDELRGRISARIGRGSPAVCPLPAALPGLGCLQALKRR